jgi:hypothetical protein
VLDLLLVHLEARNLILTGLAAENCVLFTAGDAYQIRLFGQGRCGLRSYFDDRSGGENLTQQCDGLVVAYDCVASERERGYGTSADPDASRAQGRCAGLAGDRSALKAEAVRRSARALAARA